MVSVVDVHLHKAKTRRGTSTAGGRSPAYVVYMLTGRDLEFSLETGMMICDTKAEMATSMCLQDAQEPRDP
jgi:hypothetical protein